MLRCELFISKDVCTYKEYLGRESCHNIFEKYVYWHFSYVHSGLCYKWPSGFFRRNNFQQPYHEYSAIYQYLFLKIFCNPTKIKDSTL